MTSAAFARSARRVIQGRTFGENAEIVRQAPGHRSRGKFISGEESVTAVRLASAPLTSRDMAELRQVLPEGSRLAKARKFWVVTTDADAVAAVRVVDGEQTGPDIIRYRSTDYRAIYVVDYSETGFIEVVATRPNEGADT